MTTSTPHTVVSGVAYPVSSSSDDGPPALEDFLGDTEFTIDMAGTPYLVHGCGSRLDDLVRFHEKDHALGRDVRVWHVSAGERGVTAEHVAAF